MKVGKMKAYSMGITKKQFMKEILAHQAADSFVRQTYGNITNRVFKGCAVGCSLNSVAKIKNIKLDTSKHKKYETYLGIPEWLARLEDILFENISKERIKTWPVDFAEAINEGSDLNNIKIPMLIFIVESAREKTKNVKSLAAIDGVLNELKKDVLDLKALRKARAVAAYTGAYAEAAASHAAYAAADAASVYADAAAHAANAAAAHAANAAADASAYITSYAYDAAARIKEFDKFSDKLLELLRDCK